MVLPKFCAKLAGYPKDIIVGILSGRRAIEQVNTRIRPDVALTQAWGRDAFAEQSLLADTLNAFEPVGVGMAVEGVRQAMIDTGCVQAMQSFVNSYTA